MIIYLGSVGRATVLGALNSPQRSASIFFVFCFFVRPRRQIHSGIMIYQKATANHKKHGDVCKLQGFQLDPIATSSAASDSYQAINKWLRQSKVAPSRPFNKVGCPLSWAGRTFKVWKLDFLAQASLSKTSRATKMCG